MAATLSTQPRFVKPADVARRALDQLRALGVEPEVGMPEACLDCGQAECSKVIGISVLLHLGGRTYLALPPPCPTPDDEGEAVDARDH